MLLVFLSQVIKYPADRPEYYTPPRLLIGPTADVLADGVLWLHGGTLLDNQLRDYGVWHGVFNVGLGGVAEIRLSADRLFTNLPSSHWTQLNEIATALKVALIRGRSFSMAVQLRISPDVKNEVADTMVVFSPSPHLYDFVRVYFTRTASLSLPITLRYGKFSLSAGATMYRFATRMEMRYVPSLNNCEGGVLCDSLRSWLMSDPFAVRKEPERTTFYGGYVGGTYTLRANTHLVVEMNASPRFLYRGMLKDRGIEGYLRYYPSNRVVRDTTVLVLYSFAGVRYALTRNVLTDAGIVLPYDTSLPPKDRLNLLSATLYLNFHILFSLEDLEGF